MNTKPVPIVIVLLAAAISSVFSLTQQADFSTFLFRLILSVVVFAIVGMIIKWLLDLVFNNKKQEDETDDIPEDEEEEDEEYYDEDGGESARNPDDIELEPEEEEYEQDEE